MKKWIIVQGLMLSILLLKAQQGQTEIGLLIGNNGQLDKTLHDFYFIGYETPASNYGMGRDFKVGISGRYYFTDNISSRLKFGYAIRNSQDSLLEWNEHVHHSLTHNVWNANPAICFSKQFDKLEISTGVEIPVMFVNKFKSVIDDVRFDNDSSTVVNVIKTTITMSKGFVWGINNFIQIKYFITDYLALGGEIDYGLLFAHLGNKAEYYEETFYPTTSSRVQGFDKKYRKTYFSPPEVSAGIFFRFGPQKSHCIVPGVKK